MTRDPQLPAAYHFLPHSIPFGVPGFAGDADSEKTLSPNVRDCGEWFDAFVDRVRDACGTTWLPVCRISDGEFRFALGELEPDIRLPWKRRLRMRLAQGANQVLSAGTFEANQVPRTAQLLYKLRLRKSEEVQTIGAYHSGEYSWREWRAARARYGRLLRDISRDGVLALHLMYGDRPREGHFRQFGRWLTRYGIELTSGNYVPLPFVYAALTGRRRGELLRGRRVLAVTNAGEDKRRRVEASLAREGAAEVHWLEISARRSFFDRIDPTPYVGRTDLAVIGAGVGKPNILIQLEPLKVPALDVGFLFEVWDDPRRAQWRGYCAPLD